MWHSVKNVPSNAGAEGDMGSIPGLGGGNGNLFKYFCQDSPMERGVRWATVHGIEESDMTE